MRRQHKSWGWRGGQILRDQSPSVREYVSLETYSDRVNAFLPPPYVGMRVITFPNFSHVGCFNTHVFLNSQFLNQARLNNGIVVK